MLSDMSYSQIYLNWLRDTIKEVKLKKEVTRITFPFLDLGNDFSEYYIVQKDQHQYLLTDDGVTMDNLESRGFDIKNSPKREDLLHRILCNFGISLNTDNAALEVISGLDDLPQNHHSLIQCMLKINDLFFLSNSNVKSLFDEQVKNFFDAQGISYLPDVLLRGKSKLCTTFEFAIPHTAKKEERFIKLANNINANFVRNIIFAWTDTKANRSAPSRLITLINDNNGKVTSSCIEALQEYEILPILWSEKEKLKLELAG